MDGKYECLFSSSAGVPVDAKDCLEFICDHNISVRSHQCISTLFFNEQLSMEWFKKGVYMIYILFDTDIE